MFRYMFYWITEANPRMLHQSWARELADVELDKCYSNTTLKNIFCPEIK